MKRRIIAFVITALVLALTLTGCAPTDWDNVKKATEIAQVDDEKIIMDTVKYYYAEQYAAIKVAGNAIDSGFEQLGDADYELNDKLYEECIEDVVVYATMAAIAEEEGVAIDYDEARENAYNDLILMCKNSGSLSSYYQNYLSYIQDYYTSTEDSLCDTAGELYRYRLSAYELIDKYYEDGNYAEVDKETAINEITAKINEKAKEHDAKIIYPNVRGVGIDVREEVDLKLSNK